MGKLTDCLKATKELRKQFKKDAPMMGRVGNSDEFDGVWGSMVVNLETGRCIEDLDSHFIVWNDEDGEHSPWRAKFWFRPATNKEIREYFT